MDLVVPSRAGVQQSLRGGGERGSRGGGPSKAWIPCCRRGGGPGGAWIRHGAVAWCSPRGREPGGVEQQLCRPMGWGLGRPAVLLLDRGVEKPSVI
jgi:hypothetical protein